MDDTRDNAVQQANDNSNAYYAACTAKDILESELSALAEYIRKNVAKAKSADLPTRKLMEEAIVGSMGRTYATLKELGYDCDITQTVNIAMAVEEADVEYILRDVLTDFCGRAAQAIERDMRDYRSQDDE